MTNHAAPSPRRAETRGAIVAAPLSYTGSAQRLWRLGLDTPAWVRWAVLVPLLVMAIGLAWTAVTGWYLAFGLLLVPYRLVRRGQRRRKVEATRHYQTLDAINRRPS